MSDNPAHTRAITAARSAIAPGPAQERATAAGGGARRARRRRQLMWTARLVTLLIVIGGWQLFTTWKIVDPVFFGRPTGIVLKLRDWAEHGTAFGSLWAQVWITMKEALLGFVLGVTGGIFFGVLLGQFRFLADVLGPYIKVMNAIPRISLGAIFVIWLGLGIASKVVLASVLVFFVVFFNAFQGVREVDRNFIASARVLGASRPQIVRHVVLPSALSWIIASLHVAFGFAIIGAIVGEFLGAQQGLGLVIANAQNNFDPDGVFAAMLIIAVIALTAEAFIGRLERWLLAWRPSAGDSASGT